VHQALADFDLARYRRQGPHRLSGGEKQRLVIAAVLAMQPRYLILDEPTALLDYQHQRQLMDTVAAIHAGRLGTPCTVLHITQNAAEALYAERLLILHQGKIYMDGPPEEIFLQEEALQAIGLAPPVEFSAFRRLQKLHPTMQSVHPLRLQPIL
jgi:energy-coupling factor transport system ATP-binding protein